MIVAMRADQQITDTRRGRDPRICGIGQIFC
jgi:hypothetical protein